MGDITETFKQYEAALERGEYATFADYASLFETRRVLVHTGTTPVATKDYLAFQITDSIEEEVC